VCHDGAHHTKPISTQKKSIKGCAIMPHVTANPSSLISMKNSPSNRVCAMIGHITANQSVMKAAHQSVCAMIAHHTKTIITEKAFHQSGFVPGWPIHV
jgi:hypothetical protein